MPQVDFWSGALPSGPSGVDVYFPALEGPGQGWRWVGPVVGRGAGSFANHSSYPNARYLKTDIGIFLRATEDIPSGSWIVVTYGQQFLRSRWGRRIHPRIEVS